MTRLRSFFKMLNRRRIISVLALGLGAAATVTLIWGPASVQADTAPEWLRTAAQDNLPKYPEDTCESGMTSYDLYSDARVKVLRFPEANPGSVVGYEYVQRHRPFVFEDN